jgi:hypothetical protein
MWCGPPRQQFTPRIKNISATAGYPRSIRHVRIKDARIELVRPTSRRDVSYRYPPAMAKLSGVEESTFTFSNRIHARLCLCLFSNTPPGFERAEGRADVGSSTGSDSLTSLAADAQKTTCLGCRFSER